MFPTIDRGRSHVVAAASERPVIGVNAASVPASAAISAGGGAALMPIGDAVGAPRVMRVELRNGHNVVVPAWWILRRYSSARNIRVAPRGVAAIRPVGVWGISASRPAASPRSAPWGSGECPRRAPRRRRDPLRGSWRIPARRECQNVATERQVMSSPLAFLQRPDILGVAPFQPAVKPSSSARTMTCAAVEEQVVSTSEPRRRRDAALAARRTIRAANDPRLSSLRPRTIRVAKTIRVSRLFALGRSAP